MNESCGRRATSIAELLDLFARTTTPEGKDHWQNMNVLPSDVFIATYPKSGTTWMQQIVHGLKTRGSMAFTEISEVVPFIEVAWDCGIDLNAPQPVQPRAFKTHADETAVPKGGRYIVVIRNPLDVAVSFYKFMDGWFLERGAVTIDEFLEHIMLKAEGADDYWSHLLSWWPRRGDNDVRLFFFEDMKLQLEPVVREVAKFMDLKLDDGLLEIVLRQSSMEFMKAHESQFDDNLLRDKRDAAIGLPPGGESTKVNTGKVGGHRTALSQAIKDRFEKHWTDRIFPVTGAASYDELRKTAGET